MITHGLFYLCRVVESCPRERSRMGDGFRVDLPALEKAADGVTEVIDSMSKRRVADISCPAEAFGHGRLGGTVQEFCSQAEVGVTNLIEDVKEISGRLAQCAQVYRQTDEAARAELEGILVRPVGEDPAAW